MKWLLWIIVAMCAGVGCWYFYALWCHKHSHFVVIIPSYNNIQWYTRNLDSLRAQKYTHWRAIYIDDCSTDGTGNAVRAYLAQHNLTHKVQCITQPHRCGALANLYDAIHACDDHALIVTLDGDDWFAHDQVLTVLSHIYAHPKVWMTYGSYQEYPSGQSGPMQEIPAYVIRNGSYRQHAWLSSHLRTFYAGLFKRIKKEDLQIQGTFFPKTWDMAFMFPMLEMAREHARHCTDILYVYNLDNPINDWKEDLQLVLLLERIIRAKRPYQRVMTL